MELQLITLLVCQVLLIGFGLYLIASWLFKTPYYPSSTKQLDEAFANLNIKLKEPVKFIDLGSGDGRIVVWGTHQGFVSTGVEYNPFLSLLSRLNLMLFAKKKDVSWQIINSNFSKVDLSKYNFVYLFIYPEYMNLIKDRLFKELPKGSVILCNTFHFENIIEDSKYKRFYLYYVK